DGSAGLAFLKLGVGARAIAMGDAYVAVDGDVSSVYWNPAAIVDVRNIDIGLMHSEWFEGIRYEYAGVVRSYGDQALGLSLVGLYVDDLERRDAPVATPIGHFGYFDFSLTGSYGRRLTDELTVGANAKYLQEKIDDKTATGYAVDLGARYDVPGMQGLSAGVALLNLGPQMKFVDEAFDLPVMYKVGAALDVPFDSLNGDVMFAADVVKPADGNTKVHFGMEYEYAEMIAIRFGYRSGWDNQNVSVGLGIKAGQFRLDYALVPFYSDLGETHRVSLGFTL
ncbi:MAG: PorV/PorQ family protein, partial [Candidatus Eisenbacteria bacterium]|nr:PorV/PorQ family protein [Candidatus Eisenbacteria bacterium]